MRWHHVYSLAACLGLTPLAGAQSFAPIETGPLTVGIRDFAVLPDSTNGNSSGPARMNQMTTDPLGRLFVNDQRGFLYRVTPGGGVTEYFDIKDFAGTQLNNSSGERGFQSFAFHPDFNKIGMPGYGKFYTVHSSNNRTPTPDFDPGGNSIFHTVVNEWSVAVPGAPTYALGGGSAPREVMRFDQPFGNHNAGQLSFNTTIGPGDADYGNLYFAIGDGGSGGDPQDNSEDASNPYGAILRIDPLDPDGSGPEKYGIVADNVFAADGNPATLGEIYAFGLRNPQRYGWDDQTGAMYIADIGQSSREEISVGANGADYGWDIREGTLQFEGSKTPAMTDPILEYDHNNTAVDIPTNSFNIPTLARAITVGEVARNSGIQALDGKLLLGDFPTGMIFYADVDPAIPAEGSGADPLAQLILVDAEGNQVQLLDLINEARTSRPSPLGEQTRTDLRFSMGTDGEVYVLNKQDGILRILTPVIDGDTDGDGDVDDSDLGTSFANYTGPVGASGNRSFRVGDTDLDGDIDDADLGTIFANYTGPLGPSNVPEPATLAVLGLVGLSLLSRRR